MRFVLKCIVNDLVGKPEGPRRIILGDNSDQLSHFSFVAAYDSVYAMFEVGKEYLVSFEGWPIPPGPVGWLQVDNPERPGRSNG